MKVSVLLIGDELLAGEIEDRNGPFFAEKCSEQGLQVQTIRILPDEKEEIGDAVKAASASSRLAIVCGGLGPTSDDRTTEAIAHAFGRKRVLDREHWERLRQLFIALRGKEPPAGNEKQAMFPEGAEVLPNELGTAPGYVFKEKDCIFAVMPGPPRENRPMFEKALLPWLERNMREREHVISKGFRVFGLAESEVGSRMQPLEKAAPSVRISYRFSFPEILVKLRCREEDEEGLASASREVHRLLDPHIYGTGEERLPAVLGRELAKQGLRVVTAESCTGGLAAKLLTDTPGSSQWMDRGFVTYCNEAKVDLLGVPMEILERHGAVSEPTALAMLDGGLAHSRAQVGLAITGIAGPDGGMPEKPVGTVCTAWGRRGDRFSKTYRFHWDRDYTRIISAWAAMHQLYLYIKTA